MSRSSTRAILDRSRTRIHGGCSPTSAWVDRFWHGERVSVQLGEMEDQGCIHVHSRSVSIPLVLSLLYPPFSPSYSLSLSLSATTVGSTQAGSQCVVSLRVVATLLSLSFPSTLSVASAASRRYDALRRLSLPGRDAAVNFPTIYSSDTDLAIDNNRNRRYSKQVSFFHTSPF